tara:strand:- start:194 stop:1087 length:894 start_codon:yes stop_codon:yes gene_type:complete
MLIIKSFVKRKLNIAILAGIAGVVFASYTSDNFSSAPFPPLVLVSEGQFISGSSNEEKRIANELDKYLYGHHTEKTQRIISIESDQKLSYLDNYLIMTTPVTIKQYSSFIEDTGYKTPNIDLKTWLSYGSEYSYNSTRRFAWINDIPPPNRGDHPVVLVSLVDAKNYTNWLSNKTGRNFRLPTALEWEKAARGKSGQTFPWGMNYDPTLLNSADLGPVDTTPVGLFPRGASPYGMLDAAGQVLEWTSSNITNRGNIVKGGSWNSKGCGTCRPAMEHIEPGDKKHILIGFRLIDAGNS